MQTPEISEEQLHDIDASVIEAHGITFDIETGEMTASEEAILPDSIDGLESVSKLISDLDANITGLKSQRDALVANMRKIIRVQEAKRELLVRFYQPIVDKILEDAEKDIVRTPWGAWVRRQYKGRIVAKHEGAIDWARKFCPAAIRVTEEVMVSQFDEKIREKIFSIDDDTLNKEGFEVSRPCITSFYMKS